MAGLAALYAALHRAADGQLAAFRRAWAAWVSGLQAALDAGAARAAIQRGDLAAAVATIDWPAQGERLRLLLAPVLLAAARAGLRVAADQLPTLLGRDAAGLAIRFDLLNPLALAAVDQVGAALVTGVTDTTRAALRAAIRRGLAGGEDIPTIARRIRPLIGLAGPAATAYQNYLAGLEAEALLGRLTAAQVAARAGRYADRLHRQRATLIARTETLRASNLGQQLLWQQAAADGLFQPAEWRRLWIVTRDDRTCPHCRQMFGRPGVGLTEPFATPLGPVLTPPMHPACRCAIALVRAGEERPGG
jgi:hypothetical protein